MQNVWYLLNRLTELFLPLFPVSWRYHVLSSLSSVLRVAALKPLTYGTTSASMLIITIKLRLGLSEAGSKLQVCLWLLWCLFCVLALLWLVFLTWFAMWKLFLPGEKTGPSIFLHCFCLLIHCYTRISHQCPWFLIASATEKVDSQGGQVSVHEHQHWWKRGSSTSLLLSEAAPCGWSIGGVYQVSEVVQKTLFQSALSSSVHLFIYLLHSRW